VRGPFATGAKSGEKGAAVTRFHLCDLGGLGWAAPSDFSSLPQLAEAAPRERRHLSPRDPTSEAAHTAAQPSEAADDAAAH
jgi:hypothetical protein